MIDEYETDVILAPTRPEMVEIMEDGLDLLADHCGCTYTVKTKSQGNYEAIVDAGGGMYFRVLMEMNESNINHENIRFDWGYMDNGVFASRGYASQEVVTYDTAEYYATIIRVNNGASWIFAYHFGYTAPGAMWDGYLCMRAVDIKSSITSDVYRSGKVYMTGDNERQIWPDDDYVILPNGPSGVRAIDKFDNARYCVPAGKAMLYPSLISFDNIRHLGVPTIGDEPVYWLVKNYRITPWREFYVGGVKYVTLGHVAFRSLEREQEEEA